jgi:hypothetical protein
VSCVIAAQRWVRLKNVFDSNQDRPRLVQTLLQGRLRDQFAVIVRQVALLAQAIQNPDRGSVYAKRVRQALNRSLMMARFVR